MTATPGIDWRLVRRLWRFVTPHWPLVVLVFALIGVVALVEVALPYLFKVAIDSHIAARESDGLLEIVLLLGAGMVGRAFVRMGIEYTLAVLGQRTTYDLRCAVHAHVLGRNAAFFNRHPVGGLLSRITQDVDQVGQIFTTGGVTVIVDLVTLVGIAAAMLYLSVPLTIVTVVMVPVVLPALAWSRRTMRRSLRIVGEKRAALGAFIVEHLSGLTVVQAFCRERKTAESCDQISGTYRDAAMASLQASVTVPVCDAAALISAALVLWYAAADHDVVSAGLAVAFVEYANKFYAPLSQLSQKHAAIQAALVGCERVFSLLDSGEAEPEVVRVPAAAVEATPAGANALELRDVHFGYQPDKPVLRGVSLEVAPGKCVAVVGATGAGKSTLVRLLARYYDAGAGEVLVHGRDVREWRVAELRRNLTVVQQDVFLFAGTIADNVRIGRPDASIEEVELALTRVGGGRLLERGVQAEIAERGANLSAGERQLVAFARALIRDPQVLILDEATANVDPETEHVIEQALATLFAGRASLIIAHRLTTIRRADRVVVLADGQIAEQGTRDELLAANGLYARLEEQLQDGGGQSQP